MRWLYIFIIVTLYSSSSQGQHYNIWSIGGYGRLNFNVQPPIFDSVQEVVFSKNMSVCDENGELAITKDFNNLLFDSVDNFVDTVISNKQSSFVSWPTFLLPDLQSEGNFYLIKNAYDIPYNRYDVDSFHVLQITSREVTNKSINRKKGFYLIDINDTNIVGMSTYLNEWDHWVVAFLKLDSMILCEISDNSCINIHRLKLPSKLIPRNYNTFDCASHKKYEIRFSGYGKKFVVFTPRSGCENSLNGLFDTVNRFIYYGYFDVNHSAIKSLEIIDTLKLFLNPAYVCGDYSIDAEFSANDSFLYLGLDKIFPTYNDKIRNFGTESYLLKFDVSSQNHKFLKKIILSLDSSVVRFPTINNIKLGPDGNIYFFSELNLNTSLYYISNASDSGSILINKLLMNRTLTFPNLFTLPLHAYNRRMRVDFRYTPQCTDTILIVNTSDTSNLKRFEWQISNNNFSYHDSSVALHANFCVPRSGKYWITLKGINANGVGFWSSDSVIITKRPKANFTVSSHAFCLFNSLDIYDSILTDTINQIIGGKHQLFWGDGTSSFVDSVFNQNSKVKFAHAYQKTGTFLLKYISSNGFCSDTFNSTQPIYIAPAPKPGFTVSPNVGCVPLAAKLINSYKDSLVAEKYLIYKNNIAQDSVISFAAITKGSQYVFSDTGSYTVIQILTGSSGCITTDTQYIQVLSSLNSSQSIFLYNYTWQPDTTRLAQWKSINNATKYLVTENNQTYTTQDTQMVFSPSQNHKHQLTIQAKDICGNTTSFLTAKTVVLEAENIKNNKNAVLRFTPFEGWSNKASPYKIERYNFNSHQFESIYSQTDTGFYVDENFLPAKVIDGTDSSQLMQCYRIAAVNPLNNYISLSNTVCVPYVPTVFIPNAFTPNMDGLNDRFAPITFGVAHWQLDVYNRWGQKVYSGNEQDKGWDGAYKQVPVTDEVYIYVLTWEGSKNNFYNTGFTQTGSFQVLRRK